MEITINDMTTDEQGGVTHVKWTLSASSGAFELKDVGKTKFMPDHQSPDFVPYDQLTKDAVVQWVEKSINRASIEQRLATGAAEAALTNKPLPWVQGV